MVRESLLSLLALLLPLVGAMGVLVFGERRRNLRETTTISASVLTFLLALMMLGPVKEGINLRTEIFQALPGISLLLKVDMMGMVFLLLTSSLWIAISIYSIGYMRSLGEHAQTRFYFCFAMAIFGAVGVALSGNLLSLFVFYEILTVSTFPLVAHHEDEEAILAGRKYLAYLLSGASLALFAILYSWESFGRMEFTPSGFIPLGSPKGVLLVLLLAFILGFGSKAALMPLHEWLPSAMVAPTPVSALLHAVAVVKAGVFTCLRVLLFVFGPEVLSSMGVSLGFGIFVAFTVIVANLLALREDHLKRRLAFSTINNLSVILLGGFLLSESGIRGAVLHIPFHGLMKITLFMCAGAIYVQTGKEYVSELDGIGHRMPLTMGAFALCALGLCGIPPVCGFLSKWFLCLGALEAGQWVFLVVFLVSSFLDAAYFLPIVYKAFFYQGRDLRGIREAPLIMVFPLVVTALGSVLLGIFPNLLFHFWDLAHGVARLVMGG